MLLAYFFPYIPFPYIPPRGGRHSSSTQQRDNIDYGARHLNVLLSLDTIGYLVQHEHNSRSSSILSKKMGRTILFMYNTLEITLELMLILLVFYIYSFWWNGKTYKKFANVIYIKFNF